MLSHHIELNGQPFHYRAWGHAGAPVMLFLHGFPEYSGAWNAVASRMADQYHCIAPDQRGYGQSWAPADLGKYSAGKLAGDMAALVERISPDAPVILVGHDWGASVAYALAFSRPDLVARLVIMNGVHPWCFQRELAKGGAQAEASQYIHFLRAKGSEEKLAEDDYNGFMRLFSAKMDMSWMTPALSAEYKTEWARAGRLKGMVNWYRATPLVVPKPGQGFDLPEMDLSKLQVTMPHLVLWGDGDTALLPDCLDGLDRFAPDLTIRHIKGADHWIAHQQPDAVAEAMRGWLPAPT